MPEAEDDDELGTSAISSREGAMFELANVGDDRLLDIERPKDEIRALIRRGVNGVYELYVDS